MQVYVAEARNYGSIYRTEIRVADAADGTRLSMSLSAEPESLGARIMAAALGFLIKRSVRTSEIQTIVPQDRVEPGMHHSWGEGNLLIMAWPFTAGPIR